jgi:hypothetical protein
VLESDTLKAVRELSRGLRDASSPTLECYSREFQRRIPMEKNGESLQSKWVDNACEQM